MPIVRKPENAIREIVSERTARSKTFLLPDGKKLIHARIGRIHFRDDDGSLKDIETDVELDAQAGEMVAEKLPYKFRLHRKGIGFTYQSRAGGKVTIELEAIGGQPFDGNAFYEATRAGNRITFANVAEDLDLVFVVYRGGVQTHRVLKSDKAARSWKWNIKTDAEGAARVGGELHGRDASGHRCLGLSLVDGLETWDGTVAIRDKTTRKLSQSRDITYPVVIDPDVTEEIAAGSDDGFERGTNSPVGTFISTESLFSPYVVLGRISGYYTYHHQPGFRFTSVAVAQAAAIAIATLKLNVRTGGGYAGTGTIYGYDTNDSAAWSGTTVRPSSAAKTSASTSVTAAGSTGIKSYDVTAIVQEIVDRAGWASGNDLSLFILHNVASGTAYTYFERFENAGTDEAVLEITLDAGGGGGNRRRRTIICGASL